MLSREIESVTYLELVTKHRNGVNTLFRTLHIEFYSFPLRKTYEIRLPVCRTTMVRESMFETCTIHK